MTPETGQHMLRNYLKGTVVDQINTLLTTAAYNMKNWMTLKKQEIVVCFSLVFLYLSLGNDKISTQVLI
jgi:hypothetical protein